MTAGSPPDRLAAVIRQRGAAIILRRPTRTTGPSPLPSPPDLGSVVVDGDTAEGAIAISLRSNLARGMLLTGDKIFIGGLGGTTVVMSTSSRPVPPGRSVVSAPSPGFDAVPIAPLPFDAPDGTPVEIAFAVDIRTYAVIGSYPRRLIDGTRIQSQDLSVVVSAAGMTKPEPTWLLMFEGRSLSIVDAVPAYQRGAIVSWTIQAR